MLYRISSDIPGRLSLRAARGAMSEDEARGVSMALLQVEGVTSAVAHHRSGSIVVTMSSPDPALARRRVLDAVSAFDVYNLPSVPEDDLAVPQPLANALELNRFGLDVANLVIWRLIRTFALPKPIAAAYTIVQGARYLWRGIKSLSRGHLTVEVLDAAAVTLTIARGSFSNASMVMMMLELSSIMERHVQNRVRLALRDGIVTRPDQVWAVIDGKDVQVPMSAVEKGQVLHLRTGAVLPVDGTVVEGSGELDESTMTGEARLVHKGVGATVYAGTALEDGDLKVSVIAPPGAARIDQIVTMVEQSSGLKSSAQSKAEHLADGLVPYSFLAFFLILALTRNLTKAMAVLMVDYSCAIRLSTPIAVMSAMSEASKRGVVVKGGKYMEALAAADTVVFDKTGTLTLSSPKVVAVLSFDGTDRAEILRTAACVEEHFPHSVARAIVEAAREEGLEHGEERHAKVEYVVAHGIATSIAGERACIGSHHFIFEDEGVPEPEGLAETVEQAAPTASVVYLAVGGELRGAICVSDPVRPDAARTVARLRALGIKRVLMITGDSPRAAQTVAEQLGLDGFFAQVLPEDKAAHVRALKEAGHTVVMVGDGVNDSPALATADVSVAMADASDIARAVADVTITDSSLASLPMARELSMRLMARIRADYRFIVGFNSALIALGVASVIPVTGAAVAHNLSTVLVAAANTKPYLRGRAGQAGELPSGAGEAAALPGGVAEAGELGELPGEMAALPTEEPAALPAGE